MSARKDMARAWSPGSVGNIGVGFDVLGHSLDAIGDHASVRRTGEPGVRITAIEGCVDNLPREAERNTAGAALLALQRALDLPFGFALALEKGIPLGSGMGGSASSVVAALVAAN
ncbi:MAG TPA: homoserine kinase, partial [Rhodanobacteraceae bacterium]|nr:homoserine kinase [Rhodanobacteraceae bacterium]